MAYTPSCMHACMHMALLQALSILLLASMLVPGSAEEAPSGYRIELIHVDANGGFTREELIRRAVDRTHHRAAMLSATDDPISFATDYSGNEYLMKLAIGTPPAAFWAVIDTGSDLVWTGQLKLCTRMASSSFTHVSCPDSHTPKEGPCNCKRCTCFDKLCMFKRMYKSGNTSGFMGNETLTLTSLTGTDKQVPDIKFGCAINWANAVLPESADGIVGLNHGPMSLLKQLKVTKFSYCLSEKSTLLLDDDRGLRADWSTTPLVEYAASPRYYVELHEISIGGKQLSLTKVDSKHKRKNGKGVLMFVDSGASFTVLEKTVFEKLEKWLPTALKFKRTNEKKKSGEMTCFQNVADVPAPAPAPSDDVPAPAPSDDVPAPRDQPEMELTFAGSAKMRLPWANYMIEYNDKSGLTFCLAIQEGDQNLMGNYQQRNIRMFYDLTEGDEKLSFLPSDDCSN